MTGTVLVSTPSFGARSNAPWATLEEEGLVVRTDTERHPLSAADLAEVVGDADALIVGLDRVDARVLAAAPSLRAVAKHGVGVDNIDVAAAAARGVTVLNAPGSNTGAVADLAFALLLATVRHIVPAHTATAAGRWERLYGPELAGRTLAVIGFGRIGQAVARRAAGFDMTVVAHDPFVPDERIAQLGGHPLPLDECLRRADAVTLHVPGTGGAPLLDAERIALLKPGAYLVNTARGDLIDERALADALTSGRLAGAGLDAFATEPPSGSPLLTAPNVVLTPHMGAFSDDANAAMGTTVVRDIARVLRGERPHNPVRA
ncbi:phosphoglycerate dehydrogenase [Pseudonocardia sp. DSM 110487]|uniref:phosphoglycerate dehydrogenase n=1 Tax=Pseudonocardia sp. DSM 110487 TaxID=2865833 RepID=UPI001C6A39A6|nr:phosphoglycerate dehydrogenase [Pseudonocardia sp. DSM 110487]QYN38106.1 phosphoglycerate dehydrogenase [Pseudonocardia sp. DSM 110487]